jgi:hypothetical protein
MKKKLFPLTLVLVVVSAVLFFSSCSIFEGFVLKGIWNGTFDEVSYSFDFQSKSGGFVTRAAEVYSFTYRIIDNTYYYLKFELPAVPENLLGEVLLNVTSATKFVAEITWDNGTTWSDVEDFLKQ